MIRSSSRKVDAVPADDFAIREVNSGGSPRGGGSFKLSQAVAAEREETRKRLSRELLEGNNGRNNNYNDDDDEEENEEEEEEEDEEDEGGLFGMGAPEGGGMKMSLMDLLEETDRQAGISGPTYHLGDEDEEEEEEDEEEAEEEDEYEDDGRSELCCCVCKVNHKGSAFIPCGHTFCRLCSKELSVEKGNCPVCNDFAAEVLDVF